MILPDSLIHGDCLEVMKDIPDKSIDLILCDLPYGYTQNKWDSVIPLDKLWYEYHRVTKGNAAIVLFADGMFSHELAVSNRKDYRYNLVYQKNKPVGFLNANRMPLRTHEDILVFYQHLPVYNPQMEKGSVIVRGKVGNRLSSNYGKFESDYPYESHGLRYPKSIIKDKSNTAKDGHFHPTQKPLALCEYLINTYSRGGMLC